MRQATECGEFSVNDMYAQSHSVAMSRPFSPIQANIFVRFHEGLLFDMFHKPCVYMWYVDDTFSINSVMVILQMSLNA